MLIRLALWSLVIAGFPVFGRSWTEVGLKLPRVNQSPWREGRRLRHNSSRSSCELVRLGHRPAMAFVAASGGPARVPIGCATKETLQLTGCAAQGERAIPGALVDGPPFSNGPLGVLDPGATDRYLSGQFSCPIRFWLRRGACDRLWWASLLRPLSFKSRRPAEHEREPAERIRRETQEAIAIGTHAPELLVARNRPDRDHVATTERLLLRAARPPRWSLRLERRRRAPSRPIARLGRCRLPRTRAPRHQDPARNARRFPEW